MLPSWCSIWKFKYCCIHLPSTGHDILESGTGFKTDETRHFGKLGIYFYLYILVHTHLHIVHNHTSLWISRQVSNAHLVGSYCRWLSPPPGVNFPSNQVHWQQDDNVPHRRDRGLHPRPHHRQCLLASFWLIQHAGIWTWGLFRWWACQDGWAFYDAQFSKKLCNTLSTCCKDILKTEMQAVA